jgi:AcrR family transcriptional regulator
METETPRRVGRPRSEAARRAILAAAFALAAERRPGKLTMEAIARRAAVSKETLYRWWDSKEAVLLEALAERGEREIPIPDTGELHGDLARFMRATARTLDPDMRRVLRTLAAGAAADPAFAERVRDGFLAGAGRSPPCSTARSSGASSAPTELGSRSTSSSARSGTASSLPSGR